jgi:1-deoxy-D-xylulose-5-phosphate reductoisomerase
MPSRRLIVLGSTGSIGTQALEVVAHLNELHEQGAWPKRYEVVGLAAGRNARILSEQAAQFPQAQLAISHADVRDLALEEQGSGASFPGRLVNARHGPDAAERLVREVECDIVLAAMVGAAGLPATLAAAELGRDIALANKETLVAAGSLIVPVAQRTGARLLPVDSEHSGVWQALQSLGPICPPCDAPRGLERVILTASGGPFRTWPKDRIDRATPAEALNHPTWSMGPKVTIDCASLTNKALEVIEAHWLFGLPADRIDVLIHPASIVHALVEFADGSVVAHMAAPDMRGPIQHALAFPHRLSALSSRLDWREIGRLEFEAPDLNRFPALALATQVIERGGAAGAVFNAANEAAVAAFLAGKIPFGRIPALTSAALAELGAAPITTLADVQTADAEARRFVVQSGR